MSVGLTSGLYPRFLASLIMYWSCFFLMPGQFFNILKTIATIFEGDGLSTSRKWENHCCLSNFIAFMEGLLGIYDVTNW